MTQNYKKLIFLTLIIFLLFLPIKAYSIHKNTPDLQPSPQTASVLPDISGLTWIKNNTFIGVHDIKNKADSTSPRVSLIEIPNNEHGFFWNSFDISWLDSAHISSDLESITHIPETQLYLLAESGNNKKKPSPRLFLAQYYQKQFKIISFIQWPVTIENVEGIAVAKVENQYVFLYAERSEGQESTNLQWTTLELNPLKLGQFQSISFSSPLPVQKNSRQVTDIAIDSQLRLYVASAYDPGEYGPFYSIVLQIGKISLDAQNNPIITLDSPQLIATLDGLKVEGIAIRETEANKIEVFIGTDDERYGGVLRLLPEV